MTKITGTLHADDGGVGDPPIVFVHSAAGNGGQWAAQLAHVRRSRRAITVDLRGHGRSPVGAGASDFDIPALARDVGATLDALGAGRVILVGHSLGGSVCVSLAGARPDRVAGLLLVDPSGDGRLVPKDQAAGMMAALRSEASYRAAIEGYWASLIVASSEPVRVRIMQDLRDTPPATVIGALESLLTFDPVTPLCAYAGPRLSLVSAANESPNALHALVPDLPHRKVDGVGHWIQLDAPAAVNEVLDQFVARHHL